MQNVAAMEKRRKAASSETSFGSVNKNMTVLLSSSNREVYLTM
jgi:hypothetical protein